MLSSVASWPHFASLQRSSNLLAHDDAGLLGKAEVAEYSENLTGRNDHYFITSLVDHGMLRGKSHEVSSQELSNGEFLCSLRCSTR